MFKLCIPGWRNASQSHASFPALLIPQPNPIGLIQFQEQVYHAMPAKFSFSSKSLLPSRKVRRSIIRMDVPEMHSSSQDVWCEGKLD